MDHGVSLLQDGLESLPEAALGLRDMGDSQVTPGACLEGQLDVREDTGGDTRPVVCQRRMGDECGGHRQS